MLSLSPAISPSVGVLSLHKAFCRFEGTLYMGGNSPCASCKLLRRRCAEQCIFAPFFPSDDPHKFAIVHKVFGASNVSKMLQDLPIHQRADAVSSLVYEANARVRDPVYGYAGIISYLQNQVDELQIQLAVAQTKMLRSLQMQQKPTPFAHDHDDTHDKKCSFTTHLMNCNISNNVITQEPLKTESLWAG